MATATIFSYARALAMEAATIISGAVNGSGHLILTKHDGGTVDAGYVVGPVGPSGTIIVFAGTGTPSGWLLCDGSSVLRNDYPALFAAIGTTYGAADGTHFTLPNLKGKIPVGQDAGQTEFDVLGETGGEKTHVLTSGELAGHTHTSAAHTHANQAHNHIQDAHNHTQNAHDHTSAGHTHSTPAHAHALSTVLATVVAAGSGTSDNGGGSVAQGGATGRFTHTISGSTASDGASTSGSTTPGNVGSSTPTNQATTATNQATTAPDTLSTTPGATGSTGSGTAHNNLQPYVVMNYLIKT